jgi:hypothetical protein
MSKARKFANSIYGNGPVGIPLVKRSTDYEPNSSNNALIWYNTTENKLKFIELYFDGYHIRTIVPQTKIWTYISNMISSRNTHRGSGTQNAALAFSGRIVWDYTNTTEEYNGITWSAEGNIITSRIYFAGTGGPNAALAIGGWDVNSNTLNSTEEYNGTSWSAGGNLITNRFRNDATGTQDAALTFGNAGVTSTTEEYNGTSWSAGGNLVTGRNVPSAAGSQDAALAIGGTFSNAPYLTYSTEEYNGTSWSTSTNTNRARVEANACSLNIDQTIIYGSITYVEVTWGSNIVEEYDGISWTNTSTLLFRETNNYDRTGASHGSKTAALHSETTRSMVYN